MSGAPPLGRRIAWTYASGELGANLTWNMFSGFILFYYTNVALLPAAAVGALLLLTRVLDAFIDPAVGVLVDATRTRFGRARPWLLGAGAPMVIVTVLSFSVPDWSQGAKLAWAAVTFTLAGLIYSALYIPYGALLPLMTSDPADKMRIGGLRAMAASAGSIVIYGGMLPLVAFLGGANKQLGFSASAAMMSSSTALLMLLVFATCRERDGRQGATRHVLIGASLVTMLGNQIWRVVTLFALAMFIRLGALVSVTAYFASDVLSRPWMTGVLLSSLSFSLLLGGFFSRVWLGWLGKRASNIVALAIAILLSPVMLVVRDHPVAFEVVYFVSNITIGIQSATLFILTADAVDEQEARNGQRNEGLVTSSVSFAMKVGMAAGGALTAFGLARVDYHAREVTAAARDAISVLFFAASPILAVVQMAVIAFYRAPRTSAGVATA